MLVREIIGKKEKKGDVGLELEVESDNVPLPLEVRAPWKAKAEGSLRGAPGCTVEYYTQGALEVSDSKLEKIKRLTDLLNEPKQKTLKDSPRTSFHVHVNCLNLNPKEVLAAATLYWLLEDVMMDYCGEERKGNMFCLRLKDAEAILGYVAESITSELPFTGLNHNHIRYAGLNLNALPKFGTLEFRGMRGTIDPIILDNWSTAVHHLVHYGRRFGTPSAVLDAYLAGEDIVKEAVHEKIRSTKNYSSDIDEAALRLSEFAYGIDWDEWEKRYNLSWAKKKPEERPVVVEEPDVIQWNVNLGGGGGQAVPQWAQGVFDDFEER